jgi:hypothetical protein
MPDSNIVTNNCFRLGVEDVKTRAKQIPKNALKDHLVTLPQFYQQPSSIFTDLGK